ncbi:hypothetical protein D9M68_553380 [compost metagenome]
MQAHMAGGPQHVVVEGGGALRAQAVALDQALHHRTAGQVGHRQRQAVFQGDVHAVAGGGAQHQGLHRDAGFQLAGGGVQVCLAYVEDGGGIMQRAGLAADGEHLALFLVHHRNQWDGHRPRIEHQGATLRVQRATDMLALPGRVADGQAQRIAQDVVGEHRDHLVVALHRGAGADAVGIGAGARAHAIELGGVARGHRARVVGQGEQVVARLGVVAHHAPDAVPVALDGRVHVVQVVGGLIAGVAGHHRHRGDEAHLLGDADHLRSPPAGVAAVAEAGARMQPLHAVQGDVVLFLMATGMHAQAHVVAGVGAQHRREGIARQVAAAIDVRREAGAGAGRPGGRTDGAGCQVQRRDGPVGAGL